MGVKILEFYRQAQELGGMKGKMRLAVLTALPSILAKDRPDSPEIVKKFEEAIKELRKEFK